jgi:nicotinamide-nucleotide amidase
MTVENRGVLVAAIHRVRVIGGSSTGVKTGDGFDAAQEIIIVLMQRHISMNASRQAHQSTAIIPQFPKSRAVIPHYNQNIRKHIGTIRLFMNTSQPVEVLVGAILGERGLTLSAAESCTGGLIAHRLTNIAGSSRYFVGGVVAYENRVKTVFLRVQEETLALYGAVSEPVALQMAASAWELFDTDYAVSVTGIAGPGGGTPDKPVGLTYVAFASRKGETVARRFVWTGDREANKNASAEAALMLLLDMLHQS